MVFSNVCQYSTVHTSAEGRLFVKLFAIAPAGFSPEDVAAGLSRYLWLLVAVLVVILVGVTYLTSTTHTRKLSKPGKVVFELLWLAVPFAAVVAFALTSSYRFAGALLIIGLIAVAVSYLRRKRKAPTSPDIRSSSKRRRL